MTKYALFNKQTGKQLNIKPFDSMTAAILFSFMALIEDEVDIKPV